MILTVRVDDEINKSLENIKKRLHCTKSEIVREALELYLKKIEKDKERKIENAIKKCARKDFDVYKEFESILDENI